MSKYYEKKKSDSIKDWFIITLQGRIYNLQTVID